MESICSENPVTPAVISISKADVTDDSENNKILGAFSCSNNIVDIENQQIFSSYEHCRSMKNFLLIWMDENIDETDNHTQKSIALLRDIVNSIKLFIDFNQCINFIHATTDKNIFMIISKKYIQQLIPIVQELIQLHCVYILDDEKFTLEECFKQCKKVKGVYNHIETISEVLTRDIVFERRNSCVTPISIILPSFTTNPNELEPSFMYSQLLKEIFLDTPYNDKDKEEFVKYCRDLYHHENGMMKIINEFEVNYDNQTAIWWYTRGCFIFEIMNKALRTQDIQVILKMGFFLRDLHCQIQRLYLEASNLDHLIVFRGQAMLNVDFEKIKNNKGSLLSFDSFLSTSIDYQVAYHFADSILQTPDLIGIIFQIEIHSGKSPTPFASIGKFSYFSHSEEEYLFSMNSVFRIREMKQIADRLWQINLMLTNDNDPLLSNLTEYMRQKIKGPTALHRTSQLMINMSQYDKAEEILFKLLSTVSDDDQQMLANLHHQLGFVKYEKSEWTNALLYYEKTLERQQKCLSLNHPEISTTYSNIGLVEHSMTNYSKALAYYEKALEIQQKSLPFNDLSIAITYANIAAVHYSMGKYSTALLYYQLSIEIRQIFSPANDPELAIIYNSTGVVHSSMGEYSHALEYYEKALKIQKKSLSVNHPLIIVTLTNIAAVHTSMGDTSKAIEFYEKAREIQQKSPPVNHVDLAINYTNTGFIHNLMGEYSKALSCFDEALQIQEQFLSSDHISLATTYNQIIVCCTIKKKIIQMHFFT